ncbi:adenosylcobinamide-GDP ribazoletransferase [Jiella sonneratiae]|uniref:Adenosylcobinamide-GDP ribazoletransferase n=1 Tax=Jiella sonneratiae TaxID=2816856 RepID=A0ABS3IZH0_9HYPH|nr:adenosylcobinamide-GDP ribazoletransferase [Jiella sonneratiae]MBO0902818.1 adenosylcobinamide-GDP ribazoletransferase [Jiella sonneratiae]
MALQPEDTATGQGSNGDPAKGTGAATPAADAPARYRLGEDAAVFPLVGLIAAAPAALLVLVLPVLGPSPLVVGILATAALVAATGALHEDGLGDVADGLFGHQPKERAIAIMHDSRVGSYGAIALVLSLMLRAGLVGDLVADDPARAALVVLAAAAASRGAMAFIWATTPSALDSGLAARAGQPPRGKGRRSLLIGAGIAVLLVLPAAGLAQVLLAAILAALVLSWFRRFILRRIGGQTGDCLGAAQQLCEIAILFGLATSG